MLMLQCSFPASWCWGTSIRLLVHDVFIVEKSISTSTNRCGTPSADLGVLGYVERFGAMRAICMRIDGVYLSASKFKLVRYESRLQDIRVGCSVVGMLVFVTLLV